MSDDEMSWQQCLRIAESNVAHDIQHLKGEVENLRAEVRRANARQRATWELAQRRAQRIFDLQGEVAKARDECPGFREDVDDMSMCMCGRPALGHPPNGGTPETTPTEGPGGWLLDELRSASDDLAKLHMCPNCITPWKCNGPHESEEE